MAEKSHPFAGSEPLQNDVAPCFLSNRLMTYRCYSTTQIILLWVLGYSLNESLSAEDLQ